MLWTHWTKDYEIFGISLRNPENLKMMIFNTKVLKITKIMILADFSQNIGSDKKNVMNITH